MALNKLSFVNKLCNLASSDFSVILSAQNGSCVLFSNDVNLCNKAMVNGIKAFNHEVRILTRVATTCTRVKTHNLFRVDKKALNNDVLPTLFSVVNNIVQHCYT